MTAKMVELTHVVLNTVLIPVGIVFLLFATPIAAVVRSLSWIYRAIFPETVAGKVVIITGASSGIGEVRSCCPTGLCVRPPVPPF